MTTLALPRPRNALFDRLRTIQFGIGARGVVGAGLATQRGGAVEPEPWYLSGGVSAADCFEAHLPKGAANYAASLSNLNAPGTHDAIDISSPGWNATDGWQFSGGAYLNTQFVPDADQSQSVIVRFTNNTGNPGSRLFGCLDASGQFGIQPYGGGGGWAGFYNGDMSISSPVFAAAETVAIAGSTGYRNGTAVATIGGWSSQTALTAWIGGANDGAHNWYSHPHYCVAFAFYTTVLTADQIAAITTAMNAL